ncbi:hypothetical protein ACFPRL_04925 [Pseudoclavibacter helvolus]
MAASRSTRPTWGWASSPKSSSTTRTRPSATASTHQCPTRSFTARCTSWPALSQTRTAPRSPASPRRRC